MLKTLVGGISYITIPSKRRETNEIYSKHTGWVNT